MDAKGRLRHFFINIGQNLKYKNKHELRKIAERMGLVIGLTGVALSGTVPLIALPIATAGLSMAGVSALEKVINQKILKKEKSIIAIPKKKIDRSKAKINVVDVINNIMSNEPLPLHKRDRHRIKT